MRKLKSDFKAKWLNINFAFNKKDTVIPHSILHGELVHPEIVHILVFFTNVFDIFKYLFLFATTDFLTW